MTRQQMDLFDELLLRRKQFSFFLLTVIASSGKFVARFSICLNSVLLQFFPRLFIVLLTLKWSLYGTRIQK
jgi:hypothetical protein